MDRLDWFLIVLMILLIWCSFALLILYGLIEFHPLLFRIIFLIIFMVSIIIGSEYVLYSLDRWFAHRIEKEGAKENESD